MNIGAHVRGGGKLVPSLEAGAEIGATSVQIFTQSPRMWKPSQYAPEVLAAYRDAQANHPSVTHTFCHATYLINLATPDEELYVKSVACLISNLSVGRGMASSGVVLHVGSHKGVGFETVITQIADALKRALDSADAAPDGVADCPILIENAAGDGGPVGRTLEEIEALIDACGGDERLGLCIDTQHLWASGVDYSTIAATEAFVKEIDDRIGIERLRCLHLNDSKIELGGNRDRHANIDEGTIGTKGLAPLVGHPHIRDLPLLLEVPGSGDGPRAEDVVMARNVVTAGVKLYEGTSAKATSRATAPVATKGASPVTSPAKVARPRSATGAKTVAIKTSAKSHSVGTMKDATNAPKTNASPVKKLSVKKATSATKKSVAKKASPAAKRATPTKAVPAKRSSSRMAAKKTTAKKGPAKKKATAKPAKKK